MGKAALTRQYIIEQTAPLFNQQGYAGTSLNDLTKATGLTKGAIYGNFTNKDEVALAAFDHNFAKISDAIRQRIAEEPTYIGKLLVYPRFYRDILKHNLMPGGCPLLNTAIEADDTHPQLMHKVTEAFTFWQVSVVKLVERGMESGEIHTEVAPEVFASLFISLVEGSLMLAKVTRNIVHITHAINHIEHMILGLKS